MVIVRSFSLPKLVDDRLQKMVKERDTPMSNLVCQAIIFIDRYYQDGGKRIVLDFDEMDKDVQVISVKDDAEAPQWVLDQIEKEQQFKQEYTKNKEKKKLGFTDPDGGEQWRMSKKPE